MYVHTYVQTCVYVCLSVCARARVRVCTCICVCIAMYMHTRMHAGMHSVGMHATYFRRVFLCTYVAVRLLALILMCVLYGSTPVC